MADNTKVKLPTILGIRPGELTPLLKLWRERNPSTDWTVLVKRGLKKELAQYAGKRYAHLVANGEEKAA